ncbi:Metallo-dependent phosphatase [Rickenella mellea]|uniref:Metallo-dependent phosphatase n=1 Tax=Rickenella mellea TaxID=50990 RepID=A0A4Y7QED3_9AGAM|nr:Metallo-dependent phosphatase [Rickenella mellea]
MQPNLRFLAVLLVTICGLYVVFLRSSRSDKNRKVEQPINGSFTTRIVAVGDLHSDFENAQTVLKMAGVVDEHGNWTGNVDYFVQTGDIIDRGDDTIKLYLWMETLRSQARHVGGDVFSHLGNHEWMNVIGDWRYVYPSEIKTFGSVAARQKMLSTGRIGKAWQQNYSVTSRLPLHPEAGLPNADFISLPEDQSSPFSHSALSFVHGGLSPTYQQLTPYPSRINDIGRKLLGRMQSRPPNPPHPPNPYIGLPEDATFEEKSLYDSDGPLWYRGWATDNEERVCGAIDDVLNRIGVRRLIMGHTPDFEQIVSRCGGKIIIIDTGISHAYGGVLSALSINYTITPSGTTSWTEREVISAVYPDREEILVSDERAVLRKL